LTRERGVGLLAEHGTTSRNGGTLEKAQQMAAHESAKTTKFYDRSYDTVTLHDIKRIVL
jgi:hypothetical protein